MKRQFLKGFKNLFSSSNNTPSNQESKAVKKQEIVPRVVNFGDPQPQQNSDNNLNDACNVEIKDLRYQGLQSFPSFKEIGLSKDEVFEGETIVLYEPKFISYKMASGAYEDFKLVVTDYRLCVLDPKSEPDSFALSKIERLQKYLNNEGHFKILICLKDGRKFTFKMTIESVWKKVYEQIEKFAFVKSKFHFFAYQFKEKHFELQEQYKGWKIYDPIRQFERMGIKPNRNQSDSVTLSDYKFLDNSNGRICDTYPEILVGPSRIPEDSLIRCSKFRSRNRMPALTYAYEYKPGLFSSMYRSSQSKTGVKNNRSRDDEIMLAVIGNHKSTNKDLEITTPYEKPNCVIYDARGYMAALGNKISGKGYESTEYYVNCSVEFLNISNIHAVRDSYNKVLKAVFGEDNKFYSTLADSEWYDFIFLILNGAVEIAENLKNGINILVHCSDGWDRTAQLCSLSAMLLDPYYRTIEGFEVLVEKDWVYFGHQFGVRLGQGMNDPTSQQRSQIFLQFLDCVSQLLYQYPSEFEFNYKFLKEVADQAYSNLFGNFLCNCYLQMKRFQVFDRTVSLWSYIASVKDQFLNPYYTPTTNYLEVSTSQKNMRFFKELFLSNIENFKDIYDIYSCKFTEDNLEIMYKQLKKEKELLIEKCHENEAILAELDVNLGSIQTHIQLKKNEALGEEAQDNTQEFELLNE